MAVVSKGIDIRQTTGQILFDAFFQDALGALVTSGTATVKVYEVQSDGTLKSYDFNDNTFKTTALATPTLAMSQRTGNNGATNTGYWSATLSTLTGFTVGGIYLALSNHADAAPTDQMRKFQFGSGEGDFVVDASGNIIVGNYAASKDPATYVLVTPANKLATDVSGNINLQPTGLDNISVADPGNVSNMTTLSKMLVASWRYIFKKKTMTSTQAKFYADDGTTVTATSNVSDNGTIQTWNSMT